MLNHISEEANYVFPGAGDAYYMPYLFDTYYSLHDFTLPAYIPCPN